MAELDFDYNLAFSRNLGILSEDEQFKIKNAKIGVAGLGAAGGMSLLTLARVGFTNFHISDIDTYELVNFNRQIGAKVSSVGQRKTKVMLEMLLDVNPNASVEIFAEGINEKTVDLFLEGLDLVVDGIDFFAFPARELLYERARSLGIPIVVSAPLGFSSASLVLHPDGMDWKEYFAFELASNLEEKAILLLLGFLPHLEVISYIDLTKVRFDKKSGPSIATSIQLCAAFNVSEAIKIILNKGKRVYLPYYQSFDTFLLRYHRGKGGNRLLPQRIKFNLVRKKLNALKYKNESVVEEAK